MATRDKALASRKFAGRGGCVVRVEPHFTKPVRPLRSVMVWMSMPVTRSYYLSPSAAQVSHDMKEWPRNRLRRLACEIADHFKLSSKKVRVRSSMRGYQLQIVLWEGKGTAKDHALMKSILNFASKRAKKI